MKLGGILVSILLVFGIVPIQYPFVTSVIPFPVLPQAHAATNANLFVSAENPQFNNYFAGPQVIQVVVADPNINRLDQAYGEPTVTVNGKKLRMAQNTDGNWYAYFADRNQAIAADKTSGLAGKGLDFGQFCSSGSAVSPSFTETKGFTVARAVTGSVNKPADSTFFGACTNLVTAGGVAEEHVVRQKKTLTHPTRVVTLGQLGFPDANVWPIIQLYDFSGFPQTVTVDYSRAGGDQIVNLTFDRIPTNLVSSSVDRRAYGTNNQVFVSINDPQLNIDPTEEDSWTWSSINSTNNALFYQAFDRNGNKDADGTLAMQNLIGNLTAFMFNHNGRLTIDPKAQGTRVIDFQSNAKQTLTPTRGDPAVVHTDSISAGSQLITFIEQQGVNTGVFGNWDEAKISNIVMVDSTSIRGQSATLRYNDVSQSIVASAIVMLQQNDEFHIFFKSGDFTPSPGLNIAAIKDVHKQGETVHFLLQFTKIPSSSERGVLTQKGITLTDYVTGNTYIASSKVSDLNNLPSIPNTRWAGPFSFEYKISQVLKMNDLNYIPKWAVVNQHQVVLTIVLNKDASMTKALYNVTLLGGTIDANVTVIPSITAFFDLGKVNDIAKIDTVQFVDVVDPPFVDLNDKARNATNVEILHDPVSYDLTGKDVTVLVYDGGHVDDTHRDFIDPLTGHRVQIIDPDLQVGATLPFGFMNPTWHATHVGGIVGGSGKNSMAYNPFGFQSKDRQWEGMAPEVKMLSFEYTGCDSTKRMFYNDGCNMQKVFTSGINLYHADLATMSIGTNAADGAPSYFGDYSVTALLIDDIVRGSMLDHPVILFEAAGNNRPWDGLPPDHLNFGTIDPPATAKNSIAVGAINSNDYSTTNFTSYGPTKDYRLKPDIVAPGCRSLSDDPLLTWQITSTDMGSSYSAHCGTSQSTPAAAGATALLVQKWRQTHGPTTPLPHTVKAILVHTATDLGNPGPDYRFGWGALNAQFAVDLVKDDHDHPLNPLIHVDSVNTGISPPNLPKKFTFTYFGNDDVKATLAWDDPPAAALASPTLKNDLDLLLTDPNGKEYKPFILDPLHPEKNATRGNDNINNVKMAIGNATNGGPWTATVTGTRVTDGPQDFTVIISKVFKRTTNINVVADSPTVNIGATDKIHATVSDNDTGTPVPLNGTVTFNDGNSGRFTKTICIPQGTDLTCTAGYIPSSSGTFQVTAKYSDPAHGGSSPGVSILVSPPAPSITAPTNGATPTNPVTVSGTAATGATINIINNGVSVGTAIADNTGAWSASLNLPTRSDSLTATATVSGITSQPSTAVSITVAPPIPEFPASEVVLVIAITGIILFISLASRRH